MTKFAFKAAVAAIALAVAGTAGQAAIVIKGTITQGATVTTLSFSSTSATPGQVTFSNSFTDPVWAQVIVAGKPVLADPNFNTTTLNLQIFPLTQITDLHLEISQDGLNSPANLMSSATINKLTAANVISASAKGFLGANLYDKTSPLFALNLGTGMTADGSTISSGSTTTPFAETVVYDFKFGPSAGGSSSASYSIAAVPEAATWAMMLVGFGGIGATLRSGRRSRSLLAA